MKSVAFALSFLVALLPVDGAAEEKNPVSPPIPGGTKSREVAQDEFSGKTVKDDAMAMGIIEGRRQNAPRLGELAPEFSLHSLKRGTRVSLQDLRKEKPVVLIFSSWGCDVFRESVPGLNDLRRRYAERLNFVFIYIREAHPLNGFMSSKGMVMDPTTFEERKTVAQECALQLQIETETLVDDLSDPVSTNWAAWPARVFVVDTEGRIAYAGAQGPWGYRPYEGFQHGNGKLYLKNLHYSRESLESFLHSNYGKK